MRHVSAGLLGMALLLGARAGRSGVCGSFEFSVQLSGPSGAFPLNGRVLLEANEPYVNVLEVAGGSVQFASGTSSVPARIVRRLKGGFSEGQTTQFVLAPASELLPGSSYHLSFAVPVAATIGENAIRPRLVAEMNERSLADFAFATSAERDDIAPHWLGPPTAGASVFSAGPKGTTLNAFNVRAPLGKAFAGFVLAHIQARASRETRDALFVVRDQATRIGQLDCYSMFVPLKGAYTVSLSALDPDGNELTAPGKPLVLWFAKD